MGRLTPSTLRRPHRAQGRRAPRGLGPRLTPLQGLTAHDTDEALTRAHGVGSLLSGRSSVFPKYSEISSHLEDSTFSPTQNRLQKKKSAKCGILAPGHLSSIPSGRTYAGGLGCGGPWRRLSLGGREEGIPAANVSTTSPHRFREGVFLPSGLLVKSRPPWRRAHRAVWSRCHLVPALCSPRLLGRPASGETACRLCGRRCSGAHVPEPE